MVVGREVRGNREGIAGKAKWYARGEVRGHVRGEVGEWCGGVLR